ncbi:LGFP repeat-containing protein [Corynebacterium vitaeruminis]|uniref:LGFP repeat-containing protein n=1 Tax=Corynebacterium vitaeruminis TaxID=38305 RepID=UPI0023F93FBC|nr:hypothetical protein [Corynebacterium vitaeruminis]
MKKYSVAASAAILVMAAGLSACSDDQQDAASSAASSVANNAGSAVSSAAAGAMSAAKSAGAEASAAVESAMNNTTDITVGGKQVSVPAAFASAIDSHSDDLGEPSAVDVGENGTYLVTYPEGKYLAYNEQGEPVLVQGMIAETWMSQGGFESTLGAPVAEEQTVDNGWSQEFANGTIKWVDNGTGYAAEVTPK